MSTAYDVFISYARGDQERVRPWVEALKNGGTKVFFDTESIPGGADWLTAIANAIAEVKVLICFVSQQSTTSGFVSRETTLALERNKVILPVMLDQVELQGALSLSLSGKNRVEAFAWDLHKVWDVIESSLKPAGVEWRRPTGFLQGVQRTKQDLGPEPGNVRVKRPAPAVAEPPSVFSPAVVRGWLWSIATIVAICAGLWWDVPGMLSARMLVKDPPPVDTPQPLKAGSLENEAERLTEKFYLSVNGDPLGPLEFLADKVNYCGNAGWTRARVEEDLKLMATKRPFQKYEITQPAKAEDHGGDEIACTVSVGYTSGNDVVRTRTTYDNRLVFRFDGAQLKIIEVSPALGTVVADTPVFQAEGQSKAAKDFVKSCVLSGGSLSGYTPEQIGALYVDAPVDDGKKTTRQQIIDSTRTYAERWVQRKYTLLEEPQIHQGAGTPLVEVHVALEYVASQAPVGPLPAKTVEPLPAKTQTGRIKTSYTVQFDLEGRPLIHTHAKLD